MGPLEVVAVAQQQPACGLDHLASLLVVTQPVGFIDAAPVDNVMAIFGDDVEQVVDDLGLRATVAHLVGVGRMATALMRAPFAIPLATEIYEQQLLVTGLLNDVAACGSLRSAMAAIKGVKQLYWHVLCVTREEQRSAGAIGDFRRAILRTKVSLRLFGTAEVSDEEKAAALAAAGADEGIRSVISYVEIRS